MVKYIMRSDLSRLELAVNELEKDGWKIVGGVNVARAASALVYIQTLEKKGTKNK